MVKRDKIYATDLLSSFDCACKVDKIEPFFKYDSLEINNLVYEYYASNRQFFPDSFKPEWGKEYPFFPNFNEVLISGSSLYYPQGNIRKLLDKRIIEVYDLSSKTLSLALNFGKKFEGKFGCDELGDLSSRTKLI